MAAPAVATIFAAITNATVTNIMMRLIEATSFIKGGTRQPRLLVQRHHCSKQRVLDASPVCTIFGELPRTPRNRSRVATPRYHDASDRPSRGGKGPWIS